MISNINKVLVIAPHADDGELGCGATIVKFIENNIDVFYTSFSFAEESVPEGLPRNILETEVKNSTLELGINPSNLYFHRYKVRYFSYHRQEILEDLVSLRKKIQPELVIIPNRNDVHQDHAVIVAESIRAFKFISIWGYELPWNNLSSTSNNYIKLDKGHIDKKIKAIQCYNSQSHRTYINDDFIRSLAKIRGTQIATEYAESFEIIRQIG